MHMSSLNQFLKALTFVILSLTCFNANIQAQENKSSEKAYLEATKIKTGSSRLLSEGNKLKVNANGVLYKGVLKIIDQEHIGIGDHVLALSDITKIRFKSTGSKVAGGIALGAGAGLATLGSLFIYAGITEGGFGGFFLLVLGYPITVVGILAVTTGVIILCTGKKYKSSKYKYSVSIPGNKIAPNTLNESPWQEAPKQVK